jgi:hypothetical protein
LAPTASLKKTCHSVRYGKVKRTNGAFSLIFSILFAFPNDIGWPDGQPELALLHAIRDF